MRKHVLTVFLGTVVVVFLICAGSLSFEGRRVKALDRTLEVWLVERPCTLEDGVREGDPFICYRIAEEGEELPTDVLWKTLKEFTHDLPFSKVGRVTYFPTYQDSVHGLDIELLPATFLKVVTNDAYGRTWVHVPVPPDFGGAPSLAAYFTTARHTYPESWLCQEIPECEELNAKRWR